MLVAARDAGVRAVRLRGVELDLRRPPGAAQGRGRDRPAAVAVRGHQATSTSSTPTCSRAATALQTIGLRYFNVFGPRQDPEGAYAAVIPRWVRAMLARRAGRRSTATARPAATSATSTTWCRRTCSRRTTDDAGGGQPGLQRRGRRAHVAQRAVRAAARRSSRARCRAVARRAAVHGDFRRRRRAALAGGHRQGAAAARLRADARLRDGLASGDAVVRGALRRAPAAEARCAGAA